MAKDQYKRVTDCLDKLAPIWQNRLGLSHFHIEHVYLDSFLGDDGEDDFKVTAIAENRWQYHTAKIKWYLPSAVRHAEEDLERYMVHELCHVLLGAEQSLIDVRLDVATSDGGIDWIESEMLQTQFYERLEMSTEMTARALLDGWGTAL